LSQSVEPEEVMMMLHALYTKYDALCTLHGVYKGGAWQRPAQPGYKDM
jgi:hypothetical protein